jgi:hypothetical protein
MFSRYAYEVKEVTCWVRTFSLLLGLISRCRPIERSRDSAPLASAMA